MEENCFLFQQLRPFFADCLLTMKKMDRFDLESRNGKAPGGYNCPLAETGAPFIFMNAAGQMHDVTTMVHEGGHAVHSFLSHHLELSAFKEYPMEIAEVASMAMELFSMENWEIYFKDPEELRRAKDSQLERVITIFPWIATIDKFQHWVYEHPNHTLEERTRTGTGFTRNSTPKQLIGADWKNIRKIPGKNNCTYLKCRFIILNMELRNWARSVYGCSLKKIKKVRWIIISGHSHWEELKHFRNYMKQPA